MANPTCTLAAVLSCCIVNQVHAQTRIILREKMQPGQRYHVSSRVDLSGNMTVPAAGKDAKDKQIRITGTSAVDYHERILTFDKGEVTKTIRQYERLNFEREVGGEPQRDSLRPEIRKLVLLRRNQNEVPYSPDGALTWGEIDMVRTDVFAPALSGLLPDDAVQIGSRWQAKTSAVQELTDLERIESGVLMCTFEAQNTLGGRRVARIAITGLVRGVGEDGPARHQLDGFCFFDLDANMLSYVSLRGVHSMVNAEGKELGRIEGTFVSTREPATSATVLSDPSLRGIVLEPTEENTQMLYENASAGIQLLHSRRWRIATAGIDQITLDEPQGSGIVITLEALDKLPTALQYLKEAQTNLSAQKATIQSVVPPRKVAGTASLENFALSAEIGNQAFYLDYYLSQQSNGAALVAARLRNTLDRQTMLDDVQRIARSIVITRR